MTEVTFDIMVQDEGTIVLLHAATTAAMEWLDENLAHAARWGNGYVVEHRYADAVITGAQADGLAVG